ncbi:spinster family MFS transporter [Rhizorhabdus argentea]|uniref:spinster family MFS transporter n=1 Tax=Rhizorhabdus argentea TaxID=1387174 RepID=UPI0030EDCBA6
MKIRNSRAALALLCVIYTFNFMDRQVVSVLAEPIKLDLRLSDTQLGMISGFAFAIFYTGFGLPVAALADRVSRVKVLAVACSLWSISCAACGLATNFVQLAAARIGVGLGEAGGVAPSYSIISDLFPPAERARALAVFSLGVPFGLALGSGLAGWSAAQWGWRTSLLIVCIPGLALALLLICLVPEPQRGAMDGGAIQPKASLLETSKIFFRTPAIISTAMACAIGGIPNYALMAWMPAYMIRVLGMSLTEVSIYLSLTIAIAMGAGTWLSGLFADRWGARDKRAYSWVSGGAMIAAVPFLIIGLSAQRWQIALPLMGLSLGCAGAYLTPAVSFIQNSVNASQRSTAAALQLLMVNLVGMGIGPLYVGMSSDWLHSSHGTESLRIGLAGLAPFLIAAALANLVTMRVISRSREHKHALN